MVEAVHKLKASAMHVGNLTLVALLVLVLGVVSSGLFMGLCQSSE